jgi:hypothetical protein
MEVQYTCQPRPPPTTPLQSHAQPPWMLDLSATPPPPPKRKPPTTTTTTTTDSTTATTPATTTVSTTAESSTTASTRLEEDDDAAVMTSDDNNNNSRFYVLEAIVDHCPPVSVRGLFWNWTRAGDLALQPCPGGSAGFAKWRCAPSPAGGEDAPVNWHAGAPDLSECESHWLTRLKTRLRESSAGDDDTAEDVAGELADNCRLRHLYGGDVARVADLMQALVHRVRQQLTNTGSSSSSAEAEHRAAELSRRLMEAGSLLLADGQMAGWNDLVPAERAAAGSDMVAALQEAAALQAEAYTTERTVAVRQANIVAAVRIMRANDLADQRFRPADADAAGVELVVAADSLMAHSDNGAVRLVFFYYRNMDHVLPSSTNGVKFLNSQVAGASLSSSRGRLYQPETAGRTEMSRRPAVTAVFGHIEEAAVAATNGDEPACVWWDFVGRAWSEGGCWVAATNRSHTVCQCAHLAVMAVLMGAGGEGAGGFAAAAPHGDDNPSSSATTSTMTVVIAAIVSVVICIVTVAATLVIFRRFSKSICRRGGGSGGRHHSHRSAASRRSWPACLAGEEERSGGSGSGGYYPYLSSSTTTTTLTPGTPGSGGEPGSGGSPGGQYCLSSECQVLRPLMITPLATASGTSGQPGATTIYRATFANGQQAHVIPIGQAAVNSAVGAGGVGTMKNFRPITPSASHIYMEIDPVYNTSETLSDILVSDLSDDDLRRSNGGGGNGCSSTTTSSSSDDSRGTTGRYGDGRLYQLGGGQHHHLSMRGDNNSISGLLCEQQQQQQQQHRLTNNSIDYNNSNNIFSQSVMMLGGGEPLPLTAAAYGGQHLLRLDISGQQQQQQQVLYPHQTSSGRFVGHSFGQQQDQQHSWHPHHRAQTTAGQHHQMQQHHSMAFQ